MMKLGISTYTCTWAIGVPAYERPQFPMTAKGLLEEAKRLGLSLVQYADNLPLHELPEEELEALVRQAREWKIELEVGTRGTAPALLRTYLELALRTDSKMVRTLIVDPDLSEPERHISEALPAFEAAGVTLAIENHGLHTTQHLTALFRRLGSPALGCCLDTVNSFGALETPDKVIRELAPYVVNLHVKDFDIQRIDHQMGFAITGTPAGNGRLDMDFLLAELAANGKSPNAVLELWTPYAGSVEETIRIERDWREQSVPYLKTKILGS